METLANGGFANLIDNIKGKLSGYATEQYVDDKLAVNLHPFFSAGLEDENYWDFTEYGHGFPAGCEALSDGWATLAFGDGTTGFDDMVFAVKPNKACIVDKATLLIEYRNLDFAYDDWFVSLGAGSATISSGLDEDSNVIFENGVGRIVVEGLGGDDLFYIALAYELNHNGATGTVDLRMSLYEGDYDGDYKPCWNIYFGDGVEFGNARDLSILDFFFGEKMRAFRKQAFTFGAKNKWCRTCNTEDNAPVSEKEMRAEIMRNISEK